MSATTKSARSGWHEGPRPVPWRAIAWVTWRRQRAVAVGVAALLTVTAGYLLVAGLWMHRAAALVYACHPLGSGLCQGAASDFASGYALGIGVTVALLQAVPVLIGAFAGAPLLARELETGTFRFTWSQGFGRVRWTIAMLVPAAVAVMAATGALSALISWWAGPIWGIQTDDSPFQPTIFDLRGLGLAAWTLVAFAIGALAGMLIRRVVPAMAATLAAWTGLAVAAGYMRKHYQAPLVTSNLTVPRNTWVLSQGWTRGGKPVSLSALSQALLPIHVQATTQGQFQPIGPVPQVDPMRYLVQHGYVQLTTYQPVSRFWTFQWIEAGWLAALSALLLIATVWLVRRRVV